MTSRRFQEVAELNCVSYVASVVPLVSFCRFCGICCLLFRRSHRRLRWERACTCTDTVRWSIASAWCQPDPLYYVTHREVSDRTQNYCSRNRAKSGWVGCWICLWNLIGRSVENRNFLIGSVIENSDRCRKFFSAELRPKRSLVKPPESTIVFTSSQTRTVTQFSKPSSILKRVHTPHCDRATAHKMLAVIGWNTWKESNNRIFRYTSH